MLPQPPPQSFTVHGEITGSSGMQESETDHLQLNWTASQDTRGELQVSLLWPVCLQLLQLRVLAAIFELSIVNPSEKST